MNSIEYSSYLPSSCLIICVNEVANIVNVNKFSTKEVNLNFTDLIGTNLFDFFKFNNNTNIDYFSNKSRNFEIWHSKVSFSDNDGKYHNMYATFIPFRDTANKIAYTIICSIVKFNIKDLEDKIFMLQGELANNYLYISEYRALLNKSTAVVRIKNGNIGYINKSCEKMFGYSEKEIIGKSIFFVIDDTARMHKAANIMWRRLVNNGYAKAQLMCSHKNGSRINVQAYFMIVKLTSKTTEIVGILNDVTEIYNIQKELVNIQKDVIFAMGAVSEGRSKETRNHVKRVSEYSYLLAKLYGLGDNKSNLIRIASPMHDIGKIAIPDSILHKQGKLTKDEYDIMKTHAMKGYEMLNFSKREVIQVAAQISLTHHEWWNGEGYPYNISGYDIPLFGRITAIADVFDALSNDRCYKKAWPIDEVVDYIIEHKGKQFEPYLVDLFINNLDDFLRIKSLFDDESL